MSSSIAGEKDLDSLITGFSIDAEKSRLRIVLPTPEAQRAVIDHIKYVRMHRDAKQLLVRAKIDKKDIDYTDELLLRIQTLELRMSIAAAKMMVRVPIPPNKYIDYEVPTPKEKEEMEKQDLEREAGKRREREPPTDDEKEASPSR